MKTTGKHWVRSLVVLTLAGVLSLGASGCTVIRVDGREQASVVKSRGLIDGHLAFGVSKEDRYLNVRVLGGSSSGALAEVVIWKLLRAEVGVAGFSISVLPVHLGLGTLFYDPKVPVLEDGHEDDPEPEPMPEVDDAFEDDFPETEDL